MWWLHGPSGKAEQVPQRYVASAVTENGFAFPPEAEMIIVGDPYERDDCATSGGFGARDAMNGLRRGYKFRGYRRFTPAEREAAEQEQRFGRAEQH